MDRHRVNIVNDYTCQDVNAPNSNIIYNYSNLLKMYNECIEQNYLWGHPIVEKLNKNVHVLFDLDNYETYLPFIYMVWELIGRLYRNRVSKNKYKGHIPYSSDNLNTKGPDNYYEVDNKFGYVETHKDIRNYKNIDHNDTIVPLWETINTAFANSIDNTPSSIHCDKHIDPLYQHQVNIALCAAIIQIGKQKI